MISAPNKIVWIDNEAYQLIPIWVDYWFETNEGGEAKGKRQVYALYPVSPTDNKGATNGKE